MKPLRLDGKTDEEQLNAMSTYLYEKGHRIIKEPYLLFDRETGAPKGLALQYITEPQAKRYIIHHPDLIIPDPKHLAKCIIEIDGSYHDSKAGKRKTEKRNAHYQTAKIPYIILNVADLKLLDQDWFTFLDAELKKLGLDPPTKTVK